MNTLRGWWAGVQAWLERMMRPVCRRCAGQGIVKAQGWLQVCPDCNGEQVRP